jgi:hypothetical protein
MAADRQLAAGALCGWKVPAVPQMPVVLQVGPGKQPSLSCQGRFLPNHSNVLAMKRSRQWSASVAMGNHHD